MVIARRHLAPLLAAGLAASAMDAVPVLALPGEEGRPFIRNLRPRDLGPEVDAGPQFFAVCQDPRGLLYVANNAGVLEHDGATWRKIPLANESHALSCDVDRAGRVWIGGAGTFGYLAPDERGRLAFVDLTGRLSEAERSVGDVWQTSATPEGVVFRSPFTVIRMAGERLETWKAEQPENGHVYHVGAAVGGRVWVRKHLTGLLVLEREGLRLPPGGERFAQDQIYAYLPFDGRLLLGLRTGELLVYDPQDGSAVPFPTEADAMLREGQIYHAAALADGTFAIATIRAGVAVVDRQGRLAARFDRASGLRDDSVLFAFPDREGNLWLGLNDGLSLVEHPSPLSWFGEESGLKGRVESVIRHRGSLYAATNLGLFRLRPASGPGDEAGFERVAGIDIDAFDLLDSGQGLLCAADDGLYEVEGDRARFLFKSNAHDLELSIAPGPPRLFVSTLGGVVVTERSAGGWGAPWRFKEAEDDVLRVVEAAPWELWAGTAYRGAVRIRYESRDGRVTARRVERFGEAEGLPKGQVLPFRIGGRIVFGTQRGVFVFDETARRFVPDPVFARALPSPEASVVQMLEEPGGSLWVANERRGVRLVPRPEGGYEAVPTALARLPEGTRVTSFWADADGVVWAGTDDGLFRYDPRLEPGRPAPLSVVLRRVTAAGREIFGGSGATAFELPFAANALRFELAATSFRDPGRTRYQVRLAGLDREWSPWSTETYKDYTNLPGGSYAFEVRAQDASGRVAEARLAEVRILPPWWGTWWARGLGVLAGLGLVAGVALATGRLRTRRLRAPHPRARGRGCREDPAAPRGLLDRPAHRPAQPAFLRRDRRGGGRGGGARRPGRRARRRARRSHRRPRRLQAGQRPPRPPGGGPRAPGGGGPPRPRRPRLRPPVPLGRRGVPRPGAPHRPRGGAGAGAPHPRGVPRRPHRPGRRPPRAADLLARLGSLPLVPGRAGGPLARRRAGARRPGALPGEARRPRPGDRRRAGGQCGGGRRALARLARPPARPGARPGRHGLGDARPPPAPAAGGGGVRDRPTAKLFSLMEMKDTYVERRDGGYWVAGTRVSLDSIVYAFIGGQTAESIAQSFPLLTLEQVYGAIAYYLAHRPEVDAHLEAARADYEAARRAARDADPMFYRKLAEARQRA